MSVQLFLLFLFMFLWIFLWLGGKEGRSYLLIRVLIPPPPSLGDEAGSWFLFMYVCMCACVCVYVCVCARVRVCGWLGVVIQFFH